MDDGDWVEAEISLLHQPVWNDLGNIFGHDEAAARSLLTDWLASNPHISVDTISHLGPFHTALQVHYAVVEDGDPTGMEFVEWRKRYYHLLGGRSKLQPTPAQEARLRQLGWSGS